MPQCAEISALGQYLFQQLDIESTYISGVTISEDSMKNNGDLENHSFIFLNYNGKSFIFDIAKPIILNNGDKIPRILNVIPDFKKQLIRENNFLIPATDVITQKERYYGVGNPSLLQQLNIPDKLS